MNEIGVGAVIVAVIAGLVSMLGLVIGKEQKISEFRQIWIDELRKCVVNYLVNINAISDIYSLKKAGKDIDNEALLGNYKLLNEASHGIALRVNDDEEPAKALLASMKEFDEIAEKNALTPEKIKDIEGSFIKAAKNLLKFEWKRVKRGERVFVWTKQIICLVLVILFGFLAFALFYNTDPNSQENNSESSIHLVRVEN